ncbi:hypothetical protein CLOM_g11417 [Closterium sp. NIES-68]|nr:hypothetical protein CLOM_g11417 [Closterium sp. NIES-68]GJP72958.1 hypothetical protein CLOP_g3725 [Closterium sp. NIES-67]
MARLLPALALAAALNLALLCGSEALRLTPNATAKAVANATARHGVAKPTRGPIRMYFGLGSHWSHVYKAQPDDRIVFENQGFTPGKALFQFFSQRDMDECDYSGARKLKEFHQFGETYSFTVPYTSDGGYLYFGSNRILCMVFRVAFRVPVEAYSPGY